MNTASRNDIIKYVQEHLGTTRAGARDALEAVLDGITTHLKENDRVSFSGFGTFSSYQRGPLRRYDMNTGTTRTLPARARVRFTPSPKMISRMGDSLADTPSKDPDLHG